MAFSTYMDDIEERHESSIVQSIPVLRRIQYLVAVPTQMDALAYDDCPCILEDLIETNRPHVS